MAREYFDEWMPAAADFSESAAHLIGKGRYKRAAFLLHQATESLYHCVLLVVTFYTPHVHNLAFLRTQAERIDARLTYVWPTASRKERALFEKLKEAYVKARYSKHYRVTAVDLAWLSQRIEELGQAVHAVCAERIVRLEQDAAAEIAKG